MIRFAIPDDATRICAIYNHFVQHTAITFEEQPVPPETMRRRILEITAALPWLAWEKEGELQGFCHASKWKARSAYRYSVESTIYLHPESTRRGSARSSMAPFWMICAGKDYMLSWEALPFRIRGAWLFTKN
jgi:L-amino acid N-acyltransferase YncA